MNNNPVICKICGTKNYVEENGTVVYAFGIIRGCYYCGNSLNSEGENEMIVSDGENTYWRQTVNSKLIKNGSFIDVHFVRDGIRQWIALNKNELEKFLSVTNKEGDCLVTFDEPANLKTLMNEVKRKNSFNE